MYIDMAIMIVILAVPISVLYYYSKKGPLREFPHRFPRGRIESAPGRGRWIPFVLENNNDGTVLYVSVCKINISNDGIEVKYIPPFSVIYEGFDLLASEISAIEKSFKYGIVYNVILIKSIPGQYLTIPDFFLKNKEKEILNNMGVCATVPRI